MIQPQTIYIIDDDDALRTAYAVELGKLGYRTETAADGVKGLELLTKGLPDLIVLDMLMPNLDGIGFLRELRANDAYAKLPVVVTSSFETMPDIEQFDIVKYLSKMQNPPQAVAAAIDTIMKQDKEA